ncbi:MAG: hypothetical protein FWF10_07800 [Clostridiales bacterium]|nr:hypothetical protein [Clostridiales bacterium]
MPIVYFCPCRALYAEDVCYRLQVFVCEFDQACRCGGQGCDRRQLQGDVGFYVQFAV